MLKSELKRVREFDVDVLISSIRTGRTNTIDILLPCLLLTISEKMADYLLKGTPPPDTPGIGYLTYYADDMCKKNIAFVRPLF